MRTKQTHGTRTRPTWFERISASVSAAFTVVLASALIIGSGCGLRVTAARAEEEPAWSAWGAEAERSAEKSAGKDKYGLDGLDGLAGLDDPAGGKDGSGGDDAHGPGGSIGNGGKFGEDCVSGTGRKTGTDRRAGTGIVTSSVVQVGAGAPGVRRMSAVTAAAAAAVESGDGKDGGTAGDGDGRPSAETGNGTAEESAAETAPELTDNGTGTGAGTGTGSGTGTGAGNEPADSPAAGPDTEKEPGVEETPGLDDFTEPPADTGADTGGGDGIPDLPKTGTDVGTGTGSATASTPGEQEPAGTDPETDQAPEQEPEPETDPGMEPSVDPSVDSGLGPDMEPSADAEQSSVEPAAAGDTDEIGEDDPFIEFVNEPNITVGGLSVTKQVAGISGDRQKAFPFTVTLSDTTISGMYGDMAFMAGVASFTLKDGETKTAEGLPQGITYTVAETDPGDYTVTKTGETGTIAAEEIQSCTFTNTLNSIGLPATGGTGVRIVVVCTVGLVALATIADAALSTAEDDLGEGELGVAGSDVTGGESGKSKSRLGRLLRRKGKHRAKDGDG